MINAINNVNFGNSKIASKKVIRTVVDANKSAPKGISKTPLRLEAEKDFFDKNPMISGALGVSWASLVALFGSSVLGTISDHFGS